MYCANHNHLRSPQTTVGKRKQEDVEDVPPCKKAKPNPEPSPPLLPTPNRSPTVEGTTISPSISVESSSSDASSSCDADFLLAPPRHPSNPYPSTNDREGIRKPESGCRFGSRPTSTTSSDTDSSEWKSPSEPATVSLMPASSNPPFPLSRHPLTSQNLTNLQKRLSAFLPALHSANQALEVDRAEGRLGDRNIEIVGHTDEQYIEMDLSLGVLEGKHAGIRLSDESSSESMTSADSRQGNALAERSQGLQSQSSPKKGKEQDILGKLMGRSGKGSPKAKPKIEVLS